MKRPIPFAYREHVKSAFCSIYNSSIEFSHEGKAYLINFMVARSLGRYVLIEDDSVFNEYKLAWRIDTKNQVFQMS